MARDKSRWLWHGQQRGEDPSGWDPRRLYNLTPVTYQYGKLIVFPVSEYRKDDEKASADSSQPAMLLVLNASDTFSWEELQQKVRCVFSLLRFGKPILRFSSLGKEFVHSPCKSFRFVPPSHHCLPLKTVINGGFSCADSRLSAPGCI